MIEGITSGEPIFDVIRSHSDHEVVDYPRMVEESNRSYYLFETNYGDVQLIDIKPSELKDPAPVVGIPGWATTLKDSEDAIWEVVRHGRRAITFEFPRQGNLAPPEDGFPAETTTRTEVLAEIINQLREEGIKNGTIPSDVGIDEICHSGGAVDGLRVAKKYPHLVRNIAMISPVGFMGPQDKMKQFIGRYFESIQQGNQDQREYSVKSFKKAGMEAVKYVMKNPLRAWHEVQGLLIANVKMASLVNDVRASGHKVVGIFGTEDLVLPSIRVQNAITNIDQAEIEKMKQDSSYTPQYHHRNIHLDGVISTNWPHSKILTDPKPGFGLAVAVLDTLKRQGSKTQSVGA